MTCVVLYFNFIVYQGRSWGCSLCHNKFTANRRVVHILYHPSPKLCKFFWNTGNSNELLEGYFYLFNKQNSMHLSIITIWNSCSAVGLLKYLNSSQLYRFADWWVLRPSTINMVVFRLTLVNASSLGLYKCMLIYREVKCRSPILTDWCSSL